MPIAAVSSRRPTRLTNPILLGSLLVPLGISLGSGSGRSKTGPSRTDAGQRPAPAQTVPRLGALPLARRDVERLRQILGLQRRLRDLAASPRAQRALAHRSIFREALTWLEIHGGAPDAGRSTGRRCSAEAAGRRRGAAPAAGRAAAVPPPAPAPPTPACATAERD